MLKTRFLLPLIFLGLLSTNLSAGNEFNLQKKPSVFDKIGSSLKRKAVTISYYYENIYSAYEDMQIPLLEVKDVELKAEIIADLVYGSDLDALAENTQEEVILTAEKMLVAQEISDEERATKVIARVYNLLQATKSTEENESSFLAEATERLESLTDETQEDIKLPRLGRFVSAATVDLFLQASIDAQFTEISGPIVREYTHQKIFTLDDRFKAKLVEVLEIKAFEWRRFHNKLELNDQGKKKTPIDRIFDRLTPEQLKTFVESLDHEINNRK